MIRQDFDSDHAGPWVRARCVKVFVAQNWNLINEGVDLSFRVHKLNRDPARLMVIHKAHDLDCKLVHTDFCDVTPLSDGQQGTSYLAVPWLEAAWQAGGALLESSVQPAQRFHRADQ